MLLQIVLDGVFGFINALEDAATNALLSGRPRKRSTRLSQDPAVDVKCMWNRGCFSSQACTAACLCVA